MNLQCVTDAPVRGGKQCERMQTARISRTDGVQPQASVTNDACTISSSAALARHKGKGEGGWGGKATERTGSGLVFVFFFTHDGQDLIRTGIRLLPSA